MQTAINIAIALALANIFIILPIVLWLNDMTKEDDKDDADTSQS